MSEFAEPLQSALNTLTERIDFLGKKTRSLEQENKSLREKLEELECFAYFNDASVVAMDNIKNARLATVAACATADKLSSIMEEHRAAVIRFQDIQKEHRKAMNTIATVTANSEPSSRDYGPDRNKKVFTTKDLKAAMIHGGWLKPTK